MLFPQTVIFFKSDDQKNENVVIKHPKHKYVFTFVIFYETQKFLQLKYLKTHHNTKYLAKIGSQFGQCPCDAVYIW